MEEIFQLVFEVLIEITWKGPGYLILRLLRPKGETDPNGLLVLLVGTMFWIVVALSIWGWVEVSSA